MWKSSVVVIVLTSVALGCNDPQPIETSAKDAQAPLDTAGDRGGAAERAPSVAEDAGADVVAADVAAADVAAVDVGNVDAAGAEAPIVRDAAAPDRADAAVLPPGCGDVDEPCCPGQRCKSDDSVCVGGEGGHCATCGTTPIGARAPCCAGNRCGPGRCCVHVVSDGVSAFCVGVGDVCWELGSSCTAGGSCRSGCGAEGQPCCQGLNNVYCSQIGTTCTHAMPSPAATCVACGGAGQPCCQPLESSFSIPGCLGELACKPTPAGKRCMP
jgi:hypothetical protein